MLLLYSEFFPSAAEEQAAQCIARPAAEGHTAAEGAAGEAGGQRELQSHVGGDQQGASGAGEGTCTPHQVVGQLSSATKSCFLALIS